ncbi:hypothetical protein [Staphylococcus simulans]|uniref:hypothetical protein n=1 Tax=Staphylococcus simulans TaxID=1286 RepID=UPI000763C943|nr:hypothetical protein [Staphylococcus simulans]KXA41226.1 hypothetical protein HMPREF3215_02645 [Staphylococcus simulans]
MKKLLIPLFSSLLLLTACGNSDESNKETAKNETKTHEKENKNNEKTQKKKNEQNNNQEKQENSESTEQVNEESVNDQANLGAPNSQRSTNEQYQDSPQANEQIHQQQLPVNQARQQAINEGIDMDNPSDAEIERLRELSKQSPYGLQEPSIEQQMRANANIAKQHGYTGIPNGNFGISEGSAYSDDQLDPETGLPKDDAVPHE